MKTYVRIGVLLILLALLAIPGAVQAKGILEDELVFGGSYTLESGESLDGNLVVLGGVAFLEDGSSVRGDVIMMGGTLEIGGEVDGNIIVFGGLVSLSETALVEGDVVSLGAQVDRSPGAQIKGEILSNLEGFSLPLTFTRMRGFSYPIFNMGFPGVFNILWFFTKIVLWAALAVLVILFLPEQTERVSHAAVQQPLLTGGLGLLTAAVLPPLLLLLFISVCLIPVALVLLIVAGLAWAFGLIALGYEVGKRLAALAKQEWAPAVSAGLGTLLLMFVLSASGSLLSCIGLILPFLVGVVGFGAVILTRFGTQTYTTEPSQPAGYVAPARTPEAASGESEPPAEGKP